MKCLIGTFLGISIDIPNIRNGCKLTMKFNNNLNHPLVMPWIEYTL